MPEDVVDLGDGVLEIKDAKIELHNGEYVRALLISEIGL